MPQCRKNRAFPFASCPARQACQVKMKPQPIKEPSASRDTASLLPRLWHLPRSSMNSGALGDNIRTGLVPVPPCAATPTQYGLRPIGLAEGLRERANSNFEIRFSRTDYSCIEATERQTLPKLCSLSRLELDPPRDPSIVNWWRRLYGNGSASQTTSEPFARGTAPCGPAKISFPQSHQEKGARRVSAKWSPVAGFNGQRGRHQLADRDA